MSVLDDLERLEKAATPGEWLVIGHNLVYATMHCGRREGQDIFRNRFWAGVVADQECPPQEARSSAELIAASRNALPALLRLARAAAMHLSDELGDYGPVDDMREALRELGVEV